MIALKAILHGTEPVQENIYIFGDEESVLKFLDPDNSILMKEFGATEENPIEDMEISHFVLGVWSASFISPTLGEVEFARAGKAKIVGLL